MTVPLPNSAPPEVTLEEYRLLLEARYRTLVRVDQPMVLITQVPRSGGTLLMRLLDGHPQCHTVAHEFNITLKDAQRLVPDTEAAWQLIDKDLSRSFQVGFRQSHVGLHGDHQRFPMLIPPSFQRRIYDRCLDEIDHPTERDVLNAYLTSFFNAWLDNQNLYGYERKKWVTAFMPRLLAPGKPGRPNVRKLERFREIYPDGRLISIVRDPVSWFASARAWSSRGEWTDRDEAVEAWCASAQRAVTLRESEGEDSILLLAFEDLLVHTRATIRLLAKRLGIQPTGSMMLPTFNSMPIRANSSFAAGHGGVNREPLERGKELSADDAAYIRDRAWDLYERALRLTLRDRPRKARKKPAAPA